MIDHKLVFIYFFCIQEAFTCVRNDEMPFDCSESERFYDLNRNIGVKDEVKEIESNELVAVTYGNRNEQYRDKIVGIKRPALTSPTATVPQRSEASTSIPDVVISTVAPATVTVAVTENVQSSNSIAPGNPTLAQAPTVANVSYTSINRPTKTNTLLESALKQENFVKNIRAPEIAEVTTDLSPTTIKEDEEAITEITTEFGPQTTVQVSTEEFLYTRIVPELFESNSKILTSHVEPNLSGFVDAQQNSEADQLIRNIKQLQNSLLGNVPAPAIASTEQAPTEKPLPAAPRVPLPRRFLFKADNLKNRFRH